MMSSRPPEPVVPGSLQAQCVSISSAAPLPEMAAAWNSAAGALTNVGAGPSAPAGALVKPYHQDELAH